MSSGEDLSGPIITAVTDINKQSQETLVGANQQHEPVTPLVKYGQLASRWKLLFIAQPLKY